MKNKIYFCMAVAFMIFSCNHSPKHFAVFDYGDFGPQSMSWEKIGMHWWQWDNHGADDPNYKYDIKVVVYRNAPLEQIKALFPVDRSKKKDFRYFEYQDSIRYLDEHISILEKISEEWAISLKELLLHTKQKVQQEIK
jgi:hypothetical protein